ncbi:hypothetical protein [Bailinhaonella thermotolerans]|uniref:Uncharacterized protein n=1 Tax=Bailinhaonella thermotolerans TaxID=1070861 RepID=A0A3A4BJH3_9ACTN|nr:hypothetical protein [Bailinhaonella thermotolerans]RJL31392.1 hypothetical protein D5H75_20365 [Bailinhaonella thermotolerans]
MSGAYEEHYRFTRPAVVTLALVAALFLLVTFAVTLALGIAVLLLLAIPGAPLLVAMATRRVALRVDATGVTLGSSTLRPRTAAVPWPEIHAIVLWQNELPVGPRFSRIGLWRADGLPPLPKPRGVRVATRLAPDVPADIVNASRPVSGWRLDRHRLEVAVATFAPEVPVIESD